MKIAQARVMAKTKKSEECDDLAELLTEKCGGFLTTWSEVEYMNSVSTHGAICSARQCRLTRSDADSTAPLWAPQQYLMA